MAGCERIEKCPIVNDAANGSASDFEKIKTKYCYNNHSECARHMVLAAVGGDFIPNDLLPEQVEKVKEIIDEAREWL